MDVESTFVSVLLFDADLEKYLSEYLNNKEIWFCGLVLFLLTLVVKITDLFSKIGPAYDNIKRILLSLMFWRYPKDQAKKTENNFGRIEPIFTPNSGVVEALGRMIRKYPAVCVTGPAGVGKTTIVKQVGFGSELSHFKKKYRIDLEDVNSPNSINKQSLDYSKDKAKNAFDRGFNLEREADYSVFATGILVPTLIFIDNYEQIMDDDDLDYYIRSNFVKPFSKNKLVHIVITSRIYIPDTHQFILKELENSKSLDGLTRNQILNKYPAIKLFCKLHNDIREKRSREKIVFQLEDFKIIADLCNKVSNLPLGIRLIASRSFDKKLETIRKELTETMKAEIPPPFFEKSKRHSTLFNAFIWSIKLLSDEERSFLNHLTFFKNGFFLDNLPVWPNHESVEKTKELVKKLLLHSILKEEVYTNCSESKFELYVFAKQVLEINMDEKSILLRDDYIHSICRTYLGRLKEISNQIFSETNSSVNYLDLVVQVRQDLENISYFIEWCTLNAKDLAVEILIDTERILNEIGPYLILQKLYDPLLSHYSSGEVRARLLISKARVLKSSENRSLSLSSVNEAISILESNNNISFSLGEAYMVGAYISGELGEFRLRDTILEKVHSLDKDQKDALGTINYGALVLESAKRSEKKGEIALAFKYFSKANQIYEGYDIQLGKVANAAGLFCWRIGKPEDAEEYLLKAISKYRDLGEDRWILGFKTNLGLLYADSGNYQKGLALAEEAYEKLQQEGPYGWSLINLQSRGRLISRMPNSSKHFEKAKSLLDESLSRLKELKYYESMILGQVELAELHYKYKDYKTAIGYARLSSHNCVKYSLDRSLRFFRSLLLESALLDLLNETTAARDKYYLAKELKDIVEGNNWLAYSVCFEKWDFLTNKFSDEV